MEMGMTNVMHKTNELILLFNRNNIAYKVVFLRPNRITLLVKNENYLAFCKQMKSLKKFKKIQHPYGKLYSYQFLYQMHEFQLYYKAGLFIECFFELPCMSLTPQTWIPLDKMIQESIWKESNVINGIDYLDNVTHYIFRLTWAIFKKNFFDEDDICFFNAHKAFIENDIFNKKLSMIFFKYTESLLQDLCAENYHAIRNNYITFINY
jgi:hypothetical protein